MYEPCVAWSSSRIGSMHIAQVLAPPSSPPSLGTTRSRMMHAPPRQALAALEQATARVQALITGESSAEPKLSGPPMPTQHAKTADPASKDQVAEADSKAVGAAGAAGAAGVAGAAGAAEAVERTPPWPSTAFALLPASANRKSTDGSTPTSRQRLRLSRRLTYQQYQERRRRRLGGV